MDELKIKLRERYKFTNEVIIHRLLLKPNLEVIDHLALLDNNDYVYLDLWIRKDNIPLCVNPDSENDQNIP